MHFKTKHEKKVNHNQETEETKELGPPHRIHILELADKNFKITMINIIHFNYYVYYFSHGNEMGEK